ncbi:MAG: metallophosphoesterase [Negativicutes bacterium]|nr:metallophosphoesterase [Negativicutes bacterium]
MKIGVMSDSHGRTKDFAHIVEIAAHVAFWLHAGDSNCGRDVERLRRASGKPVYSVAGNNDFLAGKSLPEDLMIETEGIKIGLVHGHRQQVKWGLHGLKEWLSDNPCQILVFGHTHEALIELWPGTLVVNPGSVGYAFFGKASFMIIDTDCRPESVELMYV